MAGLFFYDKTLPIPPHESAKGQTPERQVELFTHDGKLWLRMNEVETDTKRPYWTAQLTKREAKALIAAIEEALRYQGEPPSR